MSFDKLVDTRWQFLLFKTNPNMTIFKNGEFAHFRFFFVKKAQSKQYILQIVIIFPEKC